MKICLFGSASNRIDPIYIEKTEKLAEEMARKGHVLVFGGGGNGLMGAAARGAKRGKGEIIGVIPKFFEEESIESAYTECTKLIFCDTMNERKQIMEDLAEAFIITPGGIGTYDEFFEVLTNKQLGRHEKPIAIYNIEGFYDELEKMIRHAIGRKFVKENCLKLYESFVDPQKMLDYIEKNRPLGLKPRELKDG